MQSCCSPAFPGGQRSLFPLCGLLFPWGRGCLSSFVVPGCQGEASYSWIGRVGVGVFLQEGCIIIRPLQAPQQLHHPKISTKSPRNRQPKRSRLILASTVVSRQQPESGLYAQCDVPPARGEKEANSEQKRRREATGSFWESGRNPFIATGGCGFSSRTCQNCTFCHPSILLPPFFLESGLPGRSPPAPGTF